MGYSNGEIDLRGFSDGEIELREYSVMFYPSDLLLLLLPVSGIYISYQYLFLNETPKIGHSILNKGYL